MAAQVVIAKCILRWAYSQASAVLKAIRSVIEALILQIDQQILLLKAQIASQDPALLFEKFIWDKYESIIEEIKNTLLSGINEFGPAQDICPEFYSYITSPAIALLEASTSAFTIYKDRYLSMVSFTDQLEKKLIYWELTKEQLRATLDIIDDAIYNALVTESENLIEG